MSTGPNSTTTGSTGAITNKPSSPSSAGTLKCPNDRPVPEAPRRACFVPTLLAAALGYAERGWPVLPVAGKAPVLRDWPRNATTDSTTIRSWWQARPTSNVGIVTGPRSGLAVLDVDPRAGGCQSLGELEARVGVLPGTVTSLTGGGGVHLLYRYPDRKITSRANALGPGLDVKGHGGMVVVAPSLHPGSGRAYRWLGDCWQDALPAWPAVLLPAVELVRAPVVDRGPGLMPGTGGRPERRLEALVQFVLDSQPGERNARLHWAACRGAEMIAAGIDGSMVIDALRLAGEAVGLPPAEVRTTIQSGMRTTATAA